MAVATVTDPDALPAVLNMQQVQQLLGLARPIVYELAHRVDFPSLRIGRRILVPRDRLLSWIDAQADRP